MATELKKTRLSVYALHPIMYQTPIFAALQRRIETETLPLELRVLFGDDLSLREVFYEETQVVFKPDTPTLLSGYPYSFMKNASKDARGGFWSRINWPVFQRVRQAETDIVLIHGYETATAWMALLSAKLRGVRVIWRGEAIPRPAKKGLAEWAKRRIVTAFLRRCHAIMFSCTGNYQYLEQFFAGQDRSHFFPIPCAVDNAFFAGQRDRLRGNRTQYRQEYGFTDEDFVVVFCARLTERKRPLDLIRAAAALPNARIGILFVGDGPERKRCAALVEELGVKAHFTGFLNQSEVSRAYLCGDAAAVLSAYDPSPKAMNEAMSFELPILTTTGVGTHLDLVKNGENGFVLAVGDVPALIDRLQFLAADRSVARSMGRRSAQIVADWNFDADVDGLLAAIAHIRPGFKAPKRGTGSYRPVTAAPDAPERAAS